MDRLLRGSALAVDGGAGNRFGQAGGEHGIAADIGALLSAGAGAAHDDVLDQRGIGAGALDGGAYDRTGQIGGVHAGEPPVALTPCAARDRCDIGFTHVAAPRPDGINFAL
jgi:hypothetical protein